MNVKCIFSCKDALTLRDNDKSDKTSTFISLLLNRHRYNEVLESQERGKKEVKIKEASMTIDLPIFSSRPLSRALEGASGRSR